MSLIDAFATSTNTFLDPPSPLSHKAENRRQRKAQRFAKSGSTFRPLIAKTPKQAELLEQLAAGEDLFVVGSAGTGKTYLTARKAARALIDGKVERIIVARVTVSKPKHALGFLPGKLEQKLEPWLRPVFDGIKAEVSGQTLDQWRQDGKVEIASFEHLRGRTLSNAFIILDEAQNADFTDLKLFVTRTGEKSQLVITGDLDQIDIPNSGLADVIDLVERYDIPMKVIRFSSSDVVRSALAKAFVMAFEKEDARLKNRRNFDTDVQILDTAQSLATIPFMQTPVTSRSQPSSEI